MKLKDVFFRKMTLLYVFLIGILSFELYIVGNFTITTRANLDQKTRSSLIVVSFREEKKEIKGAEIKGKVKMASKLINVDSTLTGNECTVSPEMLKLYNVGSEVEIATNTDNTNIIKCTIKDYKGYEMYPYEVLVSQELYDSIKDEYSYLVNFSGYKSYEEVTKDKSFIGAYVPNEYGVFYESQISYQEHLLLSVISIIALIIVIIVLFVNTSGYIKAHTKKTRKKTKDNSVKLNVETSTLTIVLGLTISYLIIYIFSLI